MIHQISDHTTVGLYPDAETASKLLDISVQGIRACTLGKQKRAGGYSWERKGRPVIFKNTDGDIRYFESVSDAAEFMGFTESRIETNVESADPRWEWAPLFSPKNPFDPKFDVYAADIKKTASLGKVSLSNIAIRVTHPSDATREIYSRIQIAELMQEWDHKAALKSKLHFITPCVQTDGKRRSYAHIQAFTGLAHLDFDHLTCDAGEFRDALFSTFHFIAGAWLSASGKGVKALARIPIVTSVPEFKEYYWGLHHIMSEYVGYDPSPQNAVLPLYLSHDPEAKFRVTPAVFRTKGDNPAHRRTEPIVHSVDYDLFDQYVLISRAVRAIERIETDGHPQVRSAAYTLGGYIGGGFVDPNDADEALTAAIESNDYLSKGTEGYLKTARQMLEAGSNAPLQI